MVCRNSGVRYRTPESDKVASVASVASMCIIIVFLREWVSVGASVMQCFCDHSVPRSTKFRLWDVGW